MIYLCEECFDDNYNVKVMDNNILYPLHVINQCFFRKDFYVVCGPCVLCGLSGSIPLDFFKREILKELSYLL